MITLKPAVYSKSKTVRKTQANLLAAPEQKPNTKEAMAGHVAEYTVAGTYRPVGCLSEYADTYNETDYTILLDDGVIGVKKVNGRFVNDP